MVNAMLPDGGYETPVRRHNQSFHDGARPNASIGRVRPSEEASHTRLRAPTSAEFKVVLVGSSNAGKTCLAFRYACGGFRESCAPTVGAAFNCLVETITVPKGGMRSKRRPGQPQETERVSVKIGLWDTAGQEQFAELVPLYFRDAHAVIFVVDSTRRDGLQDLNRWVNRVCHSAPADVLRYLAVTKADKPDDERWTTLDEAIEYAEAQMPGYYATSGLDASSSILSPGRASTVAGGDYGINNNSIVRGGRCPSVATSVSTSRRSTSAAAAARAAVARPIRVFEVSSLTGENVQDMFTNIARDAYERHRMMQAASAAADHSSAPGYIRPGKGVTGKTKKLDRCC
jgi:small GTP-binding protein